MRRIIFYKTILFTVCLLFGSILITGCVDRSETSSNFVSGVEEKEEIEKNYQKEENTDEEIPEDLEEKREVSVYYVDLQTAEVVQKKAYISDEYDIWEELKTSGTLTEDCALNSLQVNSSDKTIDLNFNKATGDWIRSMGTNGETQIIGCIVNTYLQAYQCNGIKLLEEGVPLETSHGANFDGYSGWMSF